ncbi:uncharacterized protein F5Z01DRAFT_217067 [Emericellopsis atlantica]|uniref:Uncharacterized protein n=1 Tax=Emericellopsis atlantica TaxID=2614577 RepID=A0A9P7ZV18_9HYPO|nr:uncharacterized protein F5Z01DRAFT_217067 [Emericellopsis atlantica]KAG9258745.1 hypothetical protein F5Z01DRAFT_217067 [Emericellopsis atlantica]
MDASSPQATSRTAFALEPIPATIIASNEIKRRDVNIDAGRLYVGCSEIDNQVLLGGFDRGAVVGVSSEVESFAGKLALQTLARGLHDGALHNALIITPRPRAEVLLALRDALAAALGTMTDANARKEAIRGYMDKIQLAGVFDMDGAWEVLAELDRPTPPPAAPTPEIGDSQDDDKGGDEGASSSDRSPDMIIITHTGVLLTSLFTHRSSSAAHSTWQLLSSHLRYLSRTLPSSPLIFLLNSTSSPEVERRAHHAQPAQLDQTLRSVFNPPTIPGYSTLLARRNKPTFGLVFAQMLDLHVLCTNVPRTAADVERGPNGSTVTIVEVLLDDMGVWEKGRDGKGRDHREQRWGAVDLKDGHLVNAFPQREEKIYGDLRLAAGFGGPRV